MSRARVNRLAVLVAELHARHMGASAAPRAADALEAAGFKVYRHDGGLAVDEAPGVSEKLSELQAAGIDPPLVVIIRRFDLEEDDPASRGTDSDGEDRARSADGGVTPAGPGHLDPTRRSAKGGQ
jgi:hypothetical protein